MLLNITKITMYYITLLVFIEINTVEYLSLLFIYTLLNYYYNFYFIIYLFTKNALNWQ